MQTLGNGEGMHAPLHIQYKHTHMSCSCAIVESDAGTVPVRLLE